MSGTCDQFVEGTDRSMTLCLTDDELRELTKKARPSAQKRVLSYMGIPYFERTDGSVAVIRETLHPGKPTQEARPRLRLP